MHLNVPVIVSFRQAVVRDELDRQRVKRRHRLWHGQREDLSAAGDILPLLLTILIRRRAAVRTERIGIGII